MDDNYDDDTSSSPTAHAPTTWTKGTPHPANSRINHWSLNGFHQPVFTGGLYTPSEIATLRTAIHDYCASKNVTPAQLCSESHFKAVRGAWNEIAQCLPHRTVLSVYRKALRQFAPHRRGEWSEEEVESLFRLVEFYGEKWNVIQRELGRSAHGCRSKFYDWNEEVERGRWTADTLERLLRAVREALDVPRMDMDVREINRWTLDHHTKIPWTMVSFGVRRRRHDCYFKWRAMTRRSNRLAVSKGLEPVPMARSTLKFDVEMEYCRWKAEQDPKWRNKFADKCVVPLLCNDSSKGQNSEWERDSLLLDSIIQSRANRPSEVPWNSLRHLANGTAPRERFDRLVDNLAPEDALDLPLWELAKVVQGALMGSVAAEKESTENPSHVLVSKRKRADRSNSKEGTAASSERKAVSTVNIPGANAGAIRNKIKEIIEGANCDELTVKGVRKILETWLGRKLSEYQREIKALIVEVM